MCGVTAARVVEGLEVGDVRDVAFVLVAVEDVDVGASCSFDRDSRGSGKGSSARVSGVHRTGPVYELLEYPFRRAETNERTCSAS